MLSAVRAVNGPLPHGITYVYERASPLHAAFVVFWIAPSNVNRVVRMPDSLSVASKRIELVPRTQPAPARSPWRSLIVGDRMSSTRAFIEYMYQPTVMPNAPVV